MQTEQQLVTFHLNNRKTKRELQLKICEINISNEECPKYLRVKLDRTLTFKHHLDSTKNKIKSRNNIIAKLAGTSWGCNASTLRTSALSLLFSVAEYCAPVWMRSIHCKKIDVQLNVAMRTITGTVRSTPTQWLPILSHIDPSEVRKQRVSQSIINKIKRNDVMPIYNDLVHHPNKRLKSRHPIWEKSHKLNGKGHG